MGQGVPRGWDDAFLSTFITTDRADDATELEILFPGS